MLSPNAIDLTTVSDVKAWLNVTATGDDNLIQRLITGASDFIEQYLSRDIVQTTYTNERYHGNDGVQLMLRNWPIVSVTSITVTDQAANVLGSYTGANCWFDDRSIYLSTGDVFTAGRGNVQVTYVAGFTTVPYGLAQAAIELVSMRYRERERIGLASKGIEGATTSFSIKDMPASVKTILDQMKNVIPA